MKYAELLQLQSVRFILFVVALLGAFLIGRCSGPEPVVIETPIEMEKQAAQIEPVKQRAQEELSQPPVAGVEQGQQGLAGECWNITPDSYCWCYSFPEFPSHPQAVPGDIPEVSPELETGKIHEDLSEEIFDEVSEEEEEDVLPETVLEITEGSKKSPPPGEMLVEVGEKLPEIFLGYDDSICAGDLVPAVRAAVADLESQAILYGVGPLSDCSGIFHRVLMGVKARCPDQAYPPIDRYRDSRDLAYWYYEQGELILIEDILQRTDLIRPGMVFFYGRAGRKFKNFTVNDLVATRSGIDHVGVVVRVERDKKGKVSNYMLFHGHGRKGKTTASTTNWHKRNPTRASYPPFGNGLQQLVAAARIVWPVEIEKKKQSVGRKAPVSISVEEDMDEDL